MLRRILVIDADILTWFSIVRPLTRMGYVVVEVFKAREFLDLVRERDLACVFLRLELPDADGMTLLSALKRAHPTLPIVLVTPHLTGTISLEARARGALFCLQTPISLKTLQHILAILPSHADARPRGEHRPC